MMNDAESAVTRVANAAQYGGASTSIYFGFTPGEWQAIGIVGGLFVGVLGMIANALITWHFKQKHLDIAIAQSKANEDE